MKQNKHRTAEFKAKAMVLLPAGKRAHELLTNSASAPVQMQRIFGSVINFIGWTPEPGAPA